MRSRLRAVSLRTAQTALMAALLLVSKEALAVLANVEVLSLLLMLYAVSFPVAQTFAALYVFILLEGLLYGFGLWWVTYLYIWPILVLTALVFRKNETALIWAVISAIFGLSFGFFYALAFFFIDGWHMVVTTWVAGLVFDLVHCGGNFVLCLVLWTPLRRALGAVKP